MSFVLQPTAAAAVFWALTLLWGVEFVLYRSRPLPAGAPAAGRDDMLWIALAIVAGFALTATLHRLGLGNARGGALVTVRWAGLGLYATGVGLRLTAARALGRWFTRGVYVAADQELVGRGPYRWLRHPLYSGLLAIAVGIFAASGNLLGTLAGTLLVAAALARRIRREEAALGAALGRRYADWAQGRARLVPWLY